VNPWKPIALALAVFGTAPVTLAAQQVEIPPEIMEALQKDVATLHQEVMQQTIVLEPGEAAPFWAIYDEYLGEIQTMAAERTELLADFADAFHGMTDEQAMAMGRRALDFDQRRHDVMAEYFERIGDEIGGRVAGQFLQVENRIQMLKDLRLAIEIPIIGR
jgi:hypothetical protein